MDTCIMDTCIMDTCIMDTCIMDTYITDICIINVEVEKGFVVTCAWVTWPECRSEGPKANLNEGPRPRKRGLEGHKTSSVGKDLKDL